MHLPICGRHLGDDVGETRHLDSPFESEDIATSPATTTTSGLFSSQKIFFPSPDFFKALKS
jgi:hypothetical protein